MNLKMMVSNVLLTLVFFFFLIDSGGAFGLRSIAFFIVLVFFLLSILKFQPNFDPLTIVFFVLLFNIFVLSLLSIVLNEIPIQNGMVFMYFFAFIFVFFISFNAFKKENFESALFFSGLLFVISILLVHFFLLTSVVDSNLILLFLNDSFEGFFYKKVFFGFEYYVVYFQSTLLISVFSIVFYRNGKYMCYALSLFVLFLSTSRFGVAVAIVVPILINFLGEKRFSKYIVVGFPFLVIFLFLFYFYIYFENHESWNLNPYWGLSSSEARIAHVISIFDSFKSYPSFLFGQGAGSEFFTLRSNGFVNNSEISQFEFLRKFGLIVFLMFHFMILLVLIINDISKNYDLNFYFIGFYLVSMSNPVLTSIMCSLLISFSIIFRKKGSGI